VDKIRHVGTGGIKSDDPQAIGKLRLKLACLEKDQEDWRRQNAYYRKHKTMVGYGPFTEDGARRIDKAIAEGPLSEGKPHASWELSNNSAEIRRIKDRITGLEKAAQRAAEQAETGGGIVKFEGGQIVENHELMRLQILFDGKPDPDTRTLLKSHGFRWAPSQGAWQRQLNPNARADTKYYLYPALGISA